MRRRFFLYVTASVFLLPLQTPSDADDRHSDHTNNRANNQATVFMFVREGSRDLDLMLEREVGVMRDMLESAGYAVDIATPGDKALIGNDHSLTPTAKLSEVDVARYVGVILPCMAPPRGATVPDAVRQIVREAAALNLPIAASRGSVATLAKAGVLRGHRYAYASAVKLEERPEFSGGQFVGIGVVRDRTISTAGICPLASRSLGEADGTVDLMHSFIASLDERS